MLIDESLVAFKQLNHHHQSKLYFTPSANQTCHGSLIFPKPHTISISSIQTSAGKCPHKPSSAVRSEEAFENLFLEADEVKSSAID